MTQQVKEVEVEIKEALERWSEYTLADGTVLRIKPVMVGAFRGEGQFTATGEPVYNAKVTMVVDARVPDSLRK